MKQKSKTDDLVKKFHIMIETQFSTLIQAIYAKNDIVHLNSEPSTYFRSRGISHTSSCVNTLQQTGIAKRNK